MVVGLGNGSHVAELLPALAARGLTGPVRRHSSRTEDQARELGITVESFGTMARLDIAIERGRPAPPPPP